MSVLVDIHILNDKTFSGSDIWKVIINLLKISFIYCKSYCQSSEASTMKFTSFGRTMHWLIVHVKQWSCFVMRHPNSLLLTCNRPTARTLNRLITAFGQRCRNESTTRQYGWGRSAAEGDELLSWLPANCSWRSKWQKRLDACLRAQGGHFEHCFDTACRVFHDCIKRVKSVTYLISSYTVVNG